MEGERITDFGMLVQTDLVELQSELRITILLKVGHEAQTGTDP